MQNQQWQVPHRERERTDGKREHKQVPPSLSLSLFVAPTLQVLRMAGPGKGSIPDRRQYKHYRRTGTTESSYLLPTPTWEPGHDVPNLLSDRSLDWETSADLRHRERKTGWLKRGEIEKEESGNAICVEREAEKHAATFAIHRVIMRRRTAIQSNVPPGTCCEKMLLSGISFRISLGVHCICCIDKGAIPIQDLSCREVQ